MKDNRNTIRMGLVAVIAGAMLGMASWCYGATVQLREHAEVAGRTIRLDQIAKLTGKEAEQFDHTVVGHLKAGKMESTISFTAVRKALSAAGANWGLLSLRGYEKCTVKRAKAKTQAPAPHTRTKAKESGQVNLDGALTLNSRIRTMIGQLADVSLKDLKITFNDHDRKLLSGAAVGMRVSFEPMASSPIGRIPIVVREYDSKDELAKSFTVMATVAERVKAVVAVKRINRGELFTSGNIKVKTLWLTRDRGHVEKKLADVRGQAASSILRDGDLVTADELQAPTLVKRGQMMTVRCISGSLVVRMLVQAEQNGVKGDVIEARNQNSEKTLDVTVTGPQQGIIRLNFDNNGSSAGPSKGASQ